MTVSKSLPMQHCQAYRNVGDTQVHVSSSVQFSSKMVYIYALRTAHMRSTRPSLRSFPNVAKRRQLEAVSGSDVSLRPCAPPGANQVIPVLVCFFQSTLNLWTFCRKCGTPCLLGLWQLQEQRYQVLPYLDMYPKCSVFTSCRVKGLPVTFLPKLLRKLHILRSS